MAAFEKFNFKNLESLADKINDLNVNIKLTRDLTPLQKPVRVKNKTAPNSIAILPMEGCDSNPDGSPSELVIRRYKRFAGGGAGLIWYEACAITDEGRANPLQLSINKNTSDGIKAMLEAANSEALDKNGYIPVNILQLTHSGRYSRPKDKNAPVIPQHDPLLDPRVGLDGSEEVVSDAYLDELIGTYVSAAVMAREAGFDGVDIKACHRYLVSELLASHTRNGKYGGSFEGRTRFLLDVVRGVRAAVGDDMIIACRFNVFDAHPYPYGFGVDRDGWRKPDLEEPLMLARKLEETGADLLSGSAGNPYYRYQQVTRPFDQAPIGADMPDEHPLESVARLFGFTRKVQSAVGIPVVGSGYSWLRQFIPNIGAANLADCSASFVGIGREAFAYPDAPRDMLRGAMDPTKCCISCSKCTQIMRDHGKTGCVVRDGEVYLPLFNEARQNASR